MVTAQMLKRPKRQIKCRQIKGNVADVTLPYKAGMQVLSLLYHLRQHALHYSCKHKNFAQQELCRLTRT